MSFSSFWKRCCATALALYGSIDELRITLSACLNNNKTWAAMFSECLSGLCLVTVVSCSRCVPEKWQLSKKIILKGGNWFFPAMLVAIVSAPVVSKGNKMPAGYCLAVYSCFKSRTFLSFPSKRKCDAFLLMNLVSFSWSELCPTSDKLLSCFDQRHCT